MKYIHMRVGFNHQKYNSNQNRINRKIRSIILIERLIQEGKKGKRKPGRNLREKSKEKVTDALIFFSLFRFETFMPLLFNYNRLKLILWMYGIIIYENNKQGDYSS